MSKKVNTEYLTIKEGSILWTTVLVRRISSSYVTGILNRADSLSAKDGLIRKGSLCVVCSLCMEDGLCEEDSLKQGRAASNYMVGGLCVEDNPYGALLRLSFPSRPSTV
jgi:hypothetical protein